MYFFKGLILGLGIDCGIITLCDKVVLQDGSEYEKQAIEIEKNDEALNEIKTLFKGLGIKFHCSTHTKQFFDGSKLEVYRIGDFEKI